MDMNIPPSWKVRQVEARREQPKHERPNKKTSSTVEITGTTTLALSGRQEKVVPLLASVRFRGSGLFGSA